MTKPKYKIGDRFTVMSVVKIEIVEVFGISEPAYVFALCHNPIFKSAVSEKKLEAIINQST